MSNFYCLPGRAGGTPDWIRVKRIHDDSLIVKGTVLHDVRHVASDNFTNSDQRGRLRPARARFPAYKGRVLCFHLPVSMPAR